MRKTILYPGLFLFLFIILLHSCSKISDFDRGKKFMELGDYDNAVKSFELAVWNQPDNADIRYHLAQAFEKSGNRRKSYQQYSIAAKIGSKEISDRFTNWAWELYEEGDSDVDEIARLAIISNEKNAEAQFLYGQYQGYSGLPFLRDAIDRTSDKKIVEPTFELFANNRIRLTRAFLDQITTIDDGFEEFGPVIFNPVKDEIIWSRAKKNNRGRYQSKHIKLYTRPLSDTTTYELTTLGTYVAFPRCTADSLIYYSNGKQIYRFNRKDSSITRLMNGVYPDISENGNILVFTQDWNILVSDTSGENTKPLTQARRYHEFNFMPKFISPGDRIVVYYLIVKII